MNKSVYIVGTALAGLFLVGGVALAAGGPGPGGMYGGHFMGRGGMNGMGVFGTVSAINGDTLTVTSRGFNRNASTTTTFTVDATNATVMKNGTSSSLGNVAVNDMIFARGTVSGTNVTATSIMDGLPMFMGRGPGKGGNGSSTPHQPPVMIEGNGEPVIGGTVTAINGSTLTVTNKSNVTYTVDGSNATVVKKNTTSTIASVAVNDNVVIQGTVNGTSVTASSIIDQAAPAKPGLGLRIFGGIGAFFKHIFGFF